MADKEGRFILLRGLPAVMVAVHLAEQYGISPAAQALMVNVERWFLPGAVGLALGEALAVAAAKEGAPQRIMAPVVEVLILYRLRVCPRWVGTAIRVVYCIVFYHNQ
ncbi:hypothetical protein AA106555_0331 [Neokomagataea thailandica NBRC 106555]|uniref:Uncharacterized protein n=1 Tax=Neokomagataea thailandica NBRC 106555 TaxID=1223520 RepID=A0ABQ0QMU1_9PROT|nr:hypothetical protein AA106555_0331 [Neokomagataea thailandica NBRC 106555]